MHPHLFTLGQGQVFLLIFIKFKLNSRHNGNILIDSDGHIVHIDFGFLLGISPGGINFESAPFKLTSEYIELMGGIDSPIFNYFKTLLFLGFIELRKHIDSLMFILEIMLMDSDLPCF